MMKTLNTTKYLKTLPIVFMLFSFTVQADASCWSAGILNGMCYQASDKKAPNNLDTINTRYSSSSCWSAGALNGMCYTEPGTVQNSAVDTSASTTYSSQCWTAGVLNNMCYSQN